MSQEQVANEAGIGRANYARVERGEVAANILTLLRIAAALRTTVGDLTSAAEFQ